MTIEKVIKQVAKELELDEYVVRRAYYSMFEFIIETVSGMSLKDEFLSKKDFEKVKNTFYLPILGRITIPYAKYEAIWEYHILKKHLGKNSISHVQNKED